MYAISMHSTFKFITMKTSRSSLVRLYSTRQTAKPLQKNHYDMLEITPHATQNEVKSAYYKLTLQYHPDKNKSESAKQRFQDISDAYEVLSNYELRKNYDRHMMLRHQPISNVEHFKSQHGSNVYPASSQTYNFDEWVQAHYGRQLHADHLRRNAYERYKEMENLRDKEKQSSPYSGLILFFSTIMLVFFLIPQNFDRPVDKTTKEKTVAAD